MYDSVKSLEIKTYMVFYWLIFNLYRYYSSFNPTAGLAIPILISIIKEKEQIETQLAEYLAQKSLSSITINEAVPNLSK